MSSTFNPSHVQELVNYARQAASTGNYQAARDTWQTILTLLPPDASERTSVQREIDLLNNRLNPTQYPKPSFDWRKRLGPLGALLAFLAKFKTAAFVLLTKGKFLISMLAFIGLYWAMFGWWFAVGFFLAILIHELGHYWVVKAYGMQAELPMFIPGFGAYVRWSGAATDPGVRANISLAGPLFGFLAGLAAFGLYFVTGQRVCLAVAQITGWLNLLNLIPAGFFDGGRAMDAISANQRAAILALSAAILYITWESASFRDLVPWLGIAIVTTYRLFKRDVAAPREMIGYYYIAIALANGFLNWCCVNIMHIGTMDRYARY